MFGTERPNFLKVLLLYNSKDEMKNMLKWTTGLAQKVGLQGASSKIIVMLASRNSKICVRKILEIVAL